MDKEGFKRILTQKGYSYEEEGKDLVVTYGGPSGVFLPRLESIPPNVKFENSGYVDLSFLEDLPEGISFKNSGNVFLSLVERIPGGTVFLNQEDVVLEELKEIGGEVIFSNGGKVWLDSIDLSGFSKGVRFQNFGSVSPRNKFEDLGIRGISTSRILNSLIEQIYG